MTNFAGIKSALVFCSCFILLIKITNAQKALYISAEIFRKDNSKTKGYIVSIADSTIIYSDEKTEWQAKILTAHHMIPLRNIHSVYFKIKNDKALKLIIPLIAGMCSGALVAYLLTDQASKDILFIDKSIV